MDAITRARSMRELLPAMILGFAAALMGAGLATLVLDRKSEEALGRASDETISRTWDRLLKLEEEFKNLREELKNGRLAGLSYDDHELRRRQTELEDDLRKIKNELNASPGPEVLSGRSEGDQDADLEALVDRRIREREEERRDSKRSKEVADVRAWTTVAARDRARMLAKKADLNETQMERFAESLTEAMIADMARFETLKTTSSEPESRLQAITGIREGWRLLDNEMRDVFSATQFEEYERGATEERAKLVPWLDALESEIRNGSLK